MAETDGDTTHLREEHASPTAVTYAHALLELANEAKQAETIALELQGIVATLKENRLFMAFFTDPAINETEREGVMERAFRGKVSALMMNFLGVLNVKGRLGLLLQIASAYDDLLESQQGRIEVDVTVAQRLDPEQLQQVQERISRALKKDAVVHQYVDESIVGGLMVRVQDKLIDASVRYQLQAMREQLLAAKPK
jgi:F-type H+-transporting ATPase subunit delta